MKIWELRYDGINQYSILVTGEAGINIRSIFGVNGKPKQWAVRPKVKPFIGRGKKEGKPCAELSYLIAGSITLSERVYQALKDFLLPFGQLHELDCNGEIEYSYNATNLIECVDYDRSTKEFDVVSREVFLPDSVPQDTHLIFKAPYTAEVSIYLNQAAKEKFEQIATKAGLFGVRFVEAEQGLI